VSDRDLCEWAKVDQTGRDVSWTGQTWWQFVRVEVGKTGRNLSRISVID
jgi:hypothetical protein